MARKNLFHSSNWSNKHQVEFESLFPDFLPVSCLGSLLGEVERSLWGLKTLQDTGRATLHTMKEVFQSFDWPISLPEENPVCHVDLKFKGKPK